MERDLEIIENPVGDKVYKNIFIKSKKKKNSSGQWEVVHAGIDFGDHIFVEKTFAEGRLIEPKNAKWKPSFLVAFKYKGEDVSVFMKEAEHTEWAATGGIGDTVKISLIQESFVNPKTGADVFYSTLKFDKVE